MRLRNGERPSERGRGPDCVDLGEKFICCNLEQKINSPVVVDCSVLFLFCVLPPSFSSLAVHAMSLLVVVVFFSCFRRVNDSQGAEARDVTEEGSGLGAEYCSFGGDIMSD